MNAIHFCLFFVLAMVPFSAFSQAEPKNYEPHMPKPVISQFEIIGGPGISFLRGSRAVESNGVNKRRVKLGSTVGVSATHAFSSRLSLKSLVIRETKGGELHSQNTYFDEVTQAMKVGQTEEEYVFTCYTITMMFSYSAGRKTKTHLSVGPYLSHLEKQIVKTSHSPGSTGIWDQSDFNKEFEWGASISVSHQFRVNKSIFLSGSILNVWGLTDTRRPEKTYGVTKTNHTIFLLGIIIKKPKQ